MDSFNTFAFDVHSHYFQEVDCKVVPVATGYDIESNRAAYSYAKEHNLPFALGIAPQTVLMNKITYDQFLQELSYIEQKRPNAIGEIGIDWKYSKDPVQEKFFIEQISLAESLNIPFVIHSRDAEQRVYQLLKDISPKVPFVMHFFAGDYNLALRFVELGAYISIVPFHSKKRNRVIKEVPLKNLLTETDAPYAGKTPCDVIKSIEYIASVKSIDFEEVKRITFNNAKDIFNYR